MSEGERKLFPVILYARMLFCLWREKSMRNDNR